MPDYSTQLWPYGQNLNSQTTEFQYNHPPGLINYAGCIYHKPETDPMAKKSKSSKKPSSTIALNKKARHDYTVEDTFECGVMLEGWEVKSLREGRIQMTDTYVMVKDNEIFWLGGQITPLLSASTHVHPQPTRARKLLLHRREIDKLIGAVDRKGYTLVPLKMYWKQGYAKLEIGLAKGKKEHDKRAADKDRDWNREKARIMKSASH